MRGRRAALVAAAVALLAVAALAAVVLTRGGDDDESSGGVVPSVVGLEQDTAEGQLVANGFSTQVVRREDARPQGTVVAQRPTAGARADTGAVVLLTVSSGAGAPASETTTGDGDEQGEEIAVPRVVGTHHILAGSAIDAAGLVADSVAVASETACGRVLRQDPAAGTRLARGEHVRLVVSLGPDERPQTQVPGLTGDAVKARAAAREFGFTVRTVEEDEGERGVVLRQTPSALTMARELTQVTLYVGG